jgi:hypothetical protein
VYATGANDGSSTFDATTLAFLWALAGIVLGGVFTYLAARIQVKHGYYSEERKRLLALRTTSFQHLWTLTGEVPRNPSQEELRRFRTQRLMDDLNRWYFADGGMFLTNPCRTAYFNFLEELERIPLAESLSLETYNPLYQAASALRQSLAQEVAARASIQSKRI